MDLIPRIQAFIERPIDGRSLGIFRLAFGLFMVYQCYYYYSVELIQKGFLAPALLFGYDWFPFLDVLPEPAMQGILILMAIGAMLMALGVWMRVGCIVFSLGQAYFLFLEKAYYNNHIYLFVLIPLLLCFTHADHFVSLRSMKGRVGAIRRWELFILQLQIAIVYFYGGLTKINPYWLFEQEPARTAINTMPSNLIFNTLMGNEWGVYLLIYGGLLLDLSAPFLLWHKRVRNWAIWLFIAFNLTNSQIFDDIGVFPFVMLGTIILFYGADELPLLRRLPGALTDAAAKNLPQSPSWAINVLVGYFAIQLLFPFRGHFLPNPLDYTTIANRFSWRMKVDTRKIEELSFTVIDPGSNTRIPIDIAQLLNPVQINALALDPRNVVQFAHYLKREAVKRDIRNAEVKARIRIRYNGGPPQYYIDPNTDLGEAEVNPFRPIPWLVPPRSD
jgi:vitamin K-dependent gamma-carboxylase